MPDVPDPPRKFYGFKPREFTRVNSPSEPPAAAPTPPEPGESAAPAAAAFDPNARIDLQELVRTGAGDRSQLGSNKVANRANDVHGILRQNLAHDQAAGHYDLGPLDDSVRRRRIRRYWITIAVIDIPLGAFAYYVGHEAAVPFVFAIAAIAFITARLTWQTFFLRTHYRD